MDINDHIVQFDHELDSYSLLEFINSIQNLEGISNVHFRDDQQFSNPTVLTMDGRLNLTYQRKNFVFKTERSKNGSSSPLYSSLRLFSGAEEYKKEIIETLISHYKFFISSQSTDTKG